jgi:hypothetical protein
MRAARPIGAGLERIVLRSFRKATVALCVTLTACGGRSDEQPVRGANQDYLLPTNLATWQLSDSPLVAIGSTDSSTATAFHDVRSVLLDAESNIVVADAGSSEVRIFEFTGELKLRFGRSGGGPGEFSYLLRAGPYRQDSLYTAEAMGRRIAVWTADGEAARTIPLDDPRAPVDVTALPNGNFVAFYRKTEKGYNREGMISYDSVSLEVFDGGGGRVHSLPNRASQKYVASRPPVTSGIPMQPLYFEPQAVYGVGTDHVYYGWSSEWQILRQHLEEGTVDTLRFKRPRRPMTDETLNNHVQRLLDRPGSPRDERLRTYFASLLRVDSLPSFDRIIEDDSARVWVRAFRVAEDTLDHWFIFAPDGALAARATMPPSLDPMDIRDDLLAGVIRDGAQREVVVVYAITRN